jgi:signal transduction histidine kinase
MPGGLRGRFIGALVLISAVTLGASAVLLLSPLAARIRDDELENIRQQVLSGSAAVMSLRSDQIHPGSLALRRAARTLKARVGGEIAILDARDHVLVLTDPDIGTRFPETTLARRHGGAAQTVSGSGASAVAHVAVPINVQGERLVVVGVQRLTDAAEAVAVVRRAFLVAAAISLGIALLLGLLLARRLVQRLRALRDAALRVAETGPLVELQADSRRDEVGDLTRALVTMQNRLRAQEQARRTFLSTASHELRTPIASLRITLDLLRDDLDVPDPDVSDARQQAARADEQAERLAGLAADLLDLARLDDGVPARRERIELQRLTRSVLSEFDIRGDESGSTLRLTPAEPTWAVADPGAIAQILRILVDNALRHAPPGGTVTATVDGDGNGGGPSIAVHDEGGGIPEEDRERIFHRFERGGATAPGFGLGLAIGRELATRMEATLAVEDGPGTTFRLRLAAEPPDGPKGIST